MKTSKSKERAEPSRLLRNERILYLLSIILLLTIMLWPNKSDYLLGEYGLCTIKTNGEVSYYNQRNVLLKTDKIRKLWMPGKGLVFENRFYTISDEMLYRVSLTTLAYESHLNLKTSIHSLPAPDTLVHIDKNYIYLSLSRYRANSSGDRELQYHLFKYDKTTRIANEISVPNCWRGHVSVHNDRIYFTKFGTGEICYLSKGKEYQLGINGGYVSISPDGTKLAYMKLGLIKGILIYDLTNKRNYTIISYFIGTFDPRIKWSPDSTLIAVQKDNDLFASDIHIASVTCGRIVQILKDSAAFNWCLLNIN